jgi:hypothetical protein
MPSAAAISAQQQCHSVLQGAESNLLMSKTTFACGLDIRLKLQCMLLLAQAVLHITY